ncbi:tol-Pal system protein TolA-like [Drosophila bipectinata]|uniref:tol-Pal system protein TolA-like n=1 Tax=Drosophila bipectinata TaxID=42026 RepID=UPI001C8AC425|nr:vicilin-like seed storage protein At2g18540 [Drosophila bipectinata]
MSTVTVVISSEESDLEVVGDPTWNGKKEMTASAVKRSTGGRRWIPVGCTKVEERRRSDGLIMHQRVKKGRRRLALMKSAVKLARARAERAEQVRQRNVLEWRQLKLDGHERALTIAKDRRARQRRTRRLVKKAKEKTATRRKREAAEAATKRKREAAEAASRRELEEKKAKEKAASRRVRGASRWPKVPPTPRPRTEPEEKVVRRPKQVEERSVREASRWPKVPPTKNGARGGRAMDEGVVDMAGAGEADVGPTNLMSREAVGKTNPDAVSVGKRRDGGPRGEMASGTMREGGRRSGEDGTEDGP